MKTQLQLIVVYLHKLQYIVIAVHVSKSPVQGFSHYNDDIVDNDNDDDGDDIGDDDDYGDDSNDNVMTIKENYLQS